LLGRRPFPLLIFAAHELKGSSARAHHAAGVEGGGQGVCFAASKPAPFHLILGLIRRFLNALGATFKDPEQARLATKGLYLMKVFPALALPSLDPALFGRLAGPKYNPDRRKTFRKDDWARVAEAAEQVFHTLGCEEMAAWCRDAERIDEPQKAGQDKIDSVLCVLIALR
jgi:predicted RNase H-like nuclease